MLRALHIKNLAVIEDLRIELSSGFTVMTGETGAGKSILLDGISLALGMRADPALVRSGSEKAEVIAEFECGADSPSRAWLREQELADADDAALCIVRRVLGSDGRSRAFINGQSCNGASLKALSEHLISLFGQNESQTLLQAATQRDLLDQYGQYPALVDAVASAAQHHAALLRQKDTLLAKCQRSPAELSLLAHQVEELEAAALSDEELTRLPLEHKRLANAGVLMQEGAQLSEVLDGALEDALHAATHGLGNLARLDPGFEASMQQFAQAAEQLRDCARDVRRQVEALDLDPEALADVEARLSALHALARKHRVRLQDLPSHTLSLRQELDAMGDAEVALGAIDQAIIEAEAQYRSVAAALSAARSAAAARLGEVATAEVRTLGMANARLEAVVARTEGKVRTTGDDDVRFDFAANPGQAARPLAKVASGGELSRVSLALQVALWGYSSRFGVDTLIFDEVDAGIGGTVATTVGQKLAALGQRAQVLCVTHLPQVAAQGSAHLGIRKYVEDNRTRTEVQALSAPQRVDEIARMLGGAHASARQLAEALLSSP